MKIVITASTLDLKYRLGCTPSWWQLFKALYEIGNEVIVIPYLGNSIASVWWRTYDNPCSRESIAYNAYLERRKRRGISPSKPSRLSPLFKWLIKHEIRSKIQRNLLAILNKEEAVDCLLLVNVPLNHVAGLPLRIKQDTGIPVVYYDGDLPTSLPKNAVSRGFKFSYYEGADLSEYDAFLTNSEGCIPDLEALGAKNIHPFHYAVDPLLCSPVSLEKDVDVSFYGHGSDLREVWMERMITRPSREMPSTRFAVGGDGFGINLGEANLIGSLSYSEWRNLCCRSCINLNVTRSSHSTVYASSTARPFELAGFEACTVSQPYDGIENWFEVGKEIVVVNSKEEAVEAYKALLNDDQKARKIGKNARKRVLKEHTYAHRAKQLIDIIRSVQTLG